MLSLFPVQSRINQYVSYPREAWWFGFQAILKYDCEEKLYCFQGNESTISKRIGFNLQYPWATYLHCGVEHRVLCISFIYIKDTVWDHNMYY